MGCRGLQLVDVVGVHGIGYPRRKPAQVLSRWRSALHRGLTGGGDHKLPAIGLDIAWYGGLFVEPANAGHGSAGVGYAAGVGRPRTGYLSPSPALLKGAGDVAATPVSDEEAEFLAEVTSEQAAADGVPVPDHPWKGLLPPPLGPLVSVFASRVDFDWAIRAVPIVRQVWRYLHDHTLATRVRSLVAERMTGDCRVVLAHSLGSVVAYETLMLERIHRPGGIWPGTLVTLGSPLSLRAVRSRLRVGPTRPAENWVNVYDPTDPVVGVGGVSEEFPAALDHLVDNGLRPHSARRYLAQPKTGESVLAAVKPPLSAVSGPHWR